MSIVHGHHHDGDLVGFNEVEPLGDVDFQSWSYIYEPQYENYPTDAAHDFTSALPDHTKIEFPAIHDEEQHIRSESSLDVLGSSLEESEDNRGDQIEEFQEGDDQSKESENAGIVAPTTDMLHNINNMLIDYGFNRSGEVLVGLNSNVLPGDVNYQSWDHSYQKFDNHQLGLNQDSNDYSTDSSQDSSNVISPDHIVIKSQAPTQDDKEQHQSIFDVVGNSLENGDDQNEEYVEDAENDDQSEESEEEAESDDQSEESKEEGESDDQSKEFVEDAGGDKDTYEAKINEDSVQVSWAVRQPWERPQGVTFHKTNKVWEAHLWIKGVKIHNRDKNGVQVFLGCYKTEEEAKHAHDRAAIRFKKRKTNQGEAYALNFPESAQAAFMAEFGHWSLWDFVWNLRRHSLAFSTGKCRTKGVTMRTPKKQQTKYEAKISHTDSNKVKRTWCLGRFSREEDAGKAYDKALLFIKRHKTEVEKWHVISNFKPSTYKKEDIQKAGRKLKPKPT